LHGAPGAQGDLKARMKDHFPSLIAQIEGLRSPSAHESEEAREGIAAFKEKRKPSWYPQ